MLLIHYIKKLLIAVLEAPIGIGKPRRKKCLLDIFCLHFSLAPDQSETWPLLFDSSIFVSNKKQPYEGLFFIGGAYRNRTDESEFCRLVPYRLANSPYLDKMERETGLKPATSALARQRSINWAIPALCFYNIYYNNRKLEFRQAIIIIFTILLLLLNT